MLGSTLIYPANAVCIQREEFHLDSVLDGIRPEKHQRWDHIIQPVFLKLAVSFDVSPVVSKYASSQSPPRKPFKHAAKVRPLRSRNVRKVIRDGDKAFPFDCTLRTI